MRILLLSTGGHIGGEESFTRELALSLIERNHAVWVAPGGETQKQDLKDHHIPVADLKISARNPLGIIKGAFQIRNFIQSHTIDIVHCQAAGPAIMGACLKLIPNQSTAKWIFHNHGLKKTTYRWLPFFLNRLELCLAASGSELARLQAHGVRISKSKRIHNGINPALYNFDESTQMHWRASIRNELGISHEKFVIAYIGRLSPEKGCDLLLPALQKVIAHDPEFHLIIIGDGVLRQFLYCQMQNLKLSSHVTFTGFRSDIPYMLCSIDVLILPSYMETFSITSLQAMASAKPVIASDVGGNPEQIIHNFNGYLFETGNSMALSECILRLKNEQNALLMGENGRNYIKHYLNIVRMVDEIELQYKHLCEK
jgi:glycosyltransferase involved in cell wall biosynthesis